MLFLTQILHSEVGIVNNEVQNRFETEIDGGIAFLDYLYYQGDLALTYTFVPPKSRGQGIAFELVHFALEFAKAENLKVMIGCATVSIYIEQHP